MSYTTSFLVCSAFLAGIQALSQDATLTRGRLHESLASASGKLTISPELVIPEPNDPTALLLQANAVQTLSERVRTSKANAAFVSGAVSAVSNMCQEQEQARGNFPGPLPVIYCAPELPPLSELAESGASGIVVPVCSGDALEALDAIADANKEWVEVCHSALDCGLQPIPEITLSNGFAAQMKEEDVEQLVNAISETLDAEPVSILITVNADDDEQTLVSLPQIPKALAKKLPILGSIRVTAGENRLGNESQRFKGAGFTGVVLRSDCVPGFRLNPDLETVGQFWSAAISDLKSTRSKSFQFNSRNNMEKNQMAEWAKYQNNVIESGALGDPNDSYSIVDEAAGEYKGFA